MIRRSFNPRFRQPILDEIKITTIRDNPWPVGVPIMAFNWSGLPYRSKQENIAPVVVESVEPIEITKTAFGLGYWHLSHNHLSDIWRGEGFDSMDDMDAWFSKVVPSGQMVTKHLMGFRLWTCGDNDRYFDTHGKLP